jgi:hypothetical protein
MVQRQQSICLMGKVRTGSLRMEMVGCICRFRFTLVLPMSDKFIPDKSNLGIFDISINIESIYMF